MKILASSHSLKTEKLSLFTLINLTAFASVAAVLYTPALPSIMRYFHVTEGQAQLTMSLFLIGYALGQLIYGPITQRIGRKPTIYMGAAVGLFGTLLCILSDPTHSFSLLIIGRVIQALGTSVGLVLAFAMINDVHAGIRARKVISYATLAFAIMPGVAILIGGVLTDKFSWVSNFYFLAAYCIYIFLLATRLPETSPHKDPRALHIKNIWRRYSAVATDAKLLSYASKWGLSTAMIYIFSASAPIIVIRLMKVSPGTFGLVNMATVFGLVLGNLISAKLADYCRGRTVIAIGIVLMAISMIALTIIVFTTKLTLVTLYVPIFFMYIGMPLLFANASAIATAHIDDKATASSMLALINMSIAVAGVMLISVMTFPLEREIPVTYLMLIALITGLFFFSRRYKPKGV